MRRREFIGVAGLFCTSLRAHAQSARVVGFLSPAADSVTYSEGLSSGLREIGYLENQTIRLISRWAYGRLDDLPNLARELVNLKVEVLVASLTQAALAASRATTTIPIVMAGVADPVAVGLIPSLARPSGNITGTSSLSADVVVKQIELLKEAIPTVQRIGVLYNPDNQAFQRLQLAQAVRAAERTGLWLRQVEVRSPRDIAPAFDTIAQDQIKAVAILGDPLFALHANTIGEVALSRRVATASAGRPYAEAGILLNYGPSLFHLHKRAAFYVDRLLKGSSPADLPVELPTKFEMFINLKTARTLGLSLSTALYARADDVIE